MIKQVYTQSFGIIYVNAGDPTYNGYTIDQIEKMPFAGWSESDKKQYINNCKDVIQSQLTGTNEGYAECCKNINHHLVKTYLNKAL